SQIPLYATMDPQESVVRNLIAPSDCDLVVLVMWSRIGTPLSEKYSSFDGKPCHSGTEWEFLEAHRSYRKRGKPEILVYRRTEKSKTEVNDPQILDKINQWNQVEQFFSRLDNGFGNLRGGYTTYDNPDDFRVLFESNLRAIVRQKIEEQRKHPRVCVNKNRQALKLWEGSPFPGLRAFDPKDAPIFFGRGKVTDELISRILTDKKKFIAVVGASGSGKSSLVAAGLIPRLLKGAEDSERKQNWECVRFTPGEKPFVSLAAALQMPVDEEPSYEKALTWIDAILAGIAVSSYSLLYIDQFEEFLTITLPRLRGEFVEWLFQLSTIPRIRIIVTLRADFYAGCVSWEKLKFCYTFQDPL
ncbi:MAG: hypothetical protein D3910_26655, partial [Candidatus Electrothrix sp. ATG2]|nr:hypothetical protein [Candidatus Electrothrix sp. ATG2]